MITSTTFFHFFLAQIFYGLLISGTVGYVVVVQPSTHLFEGEEIVKHTRPHVMRTPTKFINEKGEEVSGTVEEPCATKILPSYRPRWGHIANGSQVEIQQDEVSNFVATFVQCQAETNESRKSCHGVQHHTYSSECVTIFEHRTANVRMANTATDFFEADIRVPIMCECRLRKFVGKDATPEKKLLKTLSQLEDFMLH